MCNRRLEPSLVGFECISDLCIPAKPRIGDFNINPETGRPQGCPSFELKKNGGKVKKADWKNSAVVDCDKNSYAPEGEALSEIVEDFADNPNTWFKVGQVRTNVKLRLRFDVHLTFT